MTPVARLLVFLHSLLPFTTLCAPLFSHRTLLFLLLESFQSCGLWALLSRSFHPIVEWRMGLKNILRKNISSWKAVSLINMNMEMWYEMWSHHRENQLSSRIRGV